MISVKTYSHNGEETGTMELPERVFGLKWNADLVHQVSIGLAANRRRGTAHAKDRGEVRGGGKKPWRQKGTGRARHGSIRSPIWVGGGVTHGPTKEKDFHKEIPKKMAKKSLLVALSAKARDREIMVVDALSFQETKTRHGVSLFKNLSHHDHLSRIQKGNGALVAIEENSKEIKRVLRNLSYVGVEEQRNLNTWKVMQYKYLVFSRTAMDAFIRRMEK